ncbi:MAG: hypothetical protein ACOC4C_01755 [Fibrobacterota bacterium]
MSSEHEVQKGLADVPSVPQELYDNISTAIIRRERVIRGLRILTAVVVICLGVLSFATYNRSVPAYTYSDTQTSRVVEDELQIIQDYLNGESIEAELEEYAVLDPFLFINSEQ